MTQLQTIINNHTSLVCRYGHRKLLSVKELIENLRPTNTVQKVVANAKCLHCRTGGVGNLKLLYVYAT